MEGFGGVARRHAAGLIIMMVKMWYAMGQNAVLFIVEDSRCLP